MASLFDKIQNVRVELSRRNLKMSGKNTFAKYDYFELADFLPVLNEIMQKEKMTAIPSFTGELATLTAINCEDPKETFTISSPFGKADLKGCHEVQMIGAVETYQRRYLYQAMFDIAECDGLNKMQGAPTKEEKPKPKKEELPFVSVGVGTKQVSAEERKAQRQIELMKLGAEYYCELVSTQWQAVLTQVSKLEGKKFSEMTDEEYAKICENIKNRKY